MAMGYEGARRSGTNGTGSATVTATEGRVVSRWWACAASGAPATVTVTPGGANQTATSEGPMTLPAGVAYGESCDPGELGPGTTIVFTDTASYHVTFAKLQG